MKIQLPLLALLSVTAVTHAAPPATRLTASDATSYQYLGAAVDICGDTAILGAHENDGTPNPIVGPGAAYVFTRDAAGAWSEQAKLTASPPVDGSWFGAAVAIDGDRAIVGSPENGPDTNGPGAAYVFVRSGSSWSQEAILTVPGLGNDSSFGGAVAIDGDTAVVGAPWGDGWAYIYTRSGSTWSLSAQITKDSGLDFAANFGSGVAIDGDRIAIGASGLDWQSYDSGAVYVFDKVGSSWVQQAFLIASDGTVVTGIGVDVDLDGDVVVAGSQNDGAYVFTRSGAGVWSETVKLTTTPSPSQFGLSVGVSGDQVVVGASDSFAAPGVRLYEFDGASWNEVDQLSDPAAQGEYGRAVAIDAGFALVGSPRDNDAGSNTGAGYVFDVRPTGTWTDLGSGLAGATGVPLLTGDGTLIGGAPTTIALTQAAPSATAFLLYGVTAINAPFLGGTLVPDVSAPGGLVILSTNPSGERTLAFPWPAGLPSGSSIYIQYWIADAGGPLGYAASNGLLATTP